MRQAKSMNHLKSMLMQFLTIFPCCFPKITILTRLRLKFSHLSNLTLCHKFKDCLKHMRNCGTEIETTKHFFVMPIPCQSKT